jgi:hypothetical protein
MCAHKAVLGGNYLGSNCDGSAFKSGLPFLCICVCSGFGKERQAPGQGQRPLHQHELHGMLLNLLLICYCSVYLIGLWYFMLS